MGKQDISLEYVFSSLVKIIKLVICNSQYLLHVGKQDISLEYGHLFQFTGKINKTSDKHFLVSITYLFILTEHV